MFVTTSLAACKSVMFDECVFNKQSYCYKHANKIQNYFILDNKCSWAWDKSEGKGRIPSGFYAVLCQKKNTIQNCSYSLPRSLSAVQSLEGMSANLIPGSIQLKRVQRHMAQGRVIWLESCAQRRRCFDSYPLFSGLSQQGAFELKQLNQAGFPDVGCNIFKGL